MLMKTRFTKGNGGRKFQADFVTVIGERRRRDLNPMPGVNLKETVDYNPEKDQWHLGFAIGVDFMEDNAEEDGLDLDSLDSDAITNAAIAIERNTLKALTRYFKTTLRDEGHSNDDLAGSIWLTTPQIKDVVKTWEDVGHGEYMLDDSSGSIWGVLKDGEVYHGVADEMARLFSLRISIFAVPEELQEACKPRKPKGGRKLTEGGARLMRKDVEQIDRLIAKRIGEKKLNKQDAANLKSLRGKGAWNATDRYFDNELQGKMMKSSPNLWAKTRGDVERVKGYVNKYLIGDDWARVMKFIADRLAANASAREPRVDMSGYTNGIGESKRPIREYDVYIGADVGDPQYFKVGDRVQVNATERPGLQNYGKITKKMSVNDGEQWWKITTDNGDTIFAAESQIMHMRESVKEAEAWAPPAKLVARLKQLEGDDLDLDDINEEFGPGKLKDKVAANVEFLLKKELKAEWKGLHVAFGPGEPNWEVEDGEDREDGSSNGMLSINGLFSVFAGDNMVFTGNVFGRGLAYADAGDTEPTYTLDGITVIIGEVF